MNRQRKTQKQKSSLPESCLFKSTMPIHNSCEIGRLTQPTYLESVVVVRLAPLLLWFDWTEMKTHFSSNNPQTPFRTKDIPNLLIAYNVTKWYAFTKGWMYGKIELCIMILFMVFEFKQIQRIIHPKVTVVFIYHMIIV